MVFPGGFFSLKIFPTKKSLQLLRHPPPLEDQQLSPFRWNLGILQLDRIHSLVVAKAWRVDSWSDHKKNGWIRSKPLPKSGILIQLMALPKRSFRKTVYCTKIFGPKMVVEKLMMIFIPWVPRIR